MIVISEWSEAWARKFGETARRIRGELGDRALRIDHIGSTSVAGLAAKPIVDIQVSVADFEPMDALVAAMDAAGFVWRAANPELTKRYFRERPGEERTHVHVRLDGSWHQQWALLFRDYMRAHPAEHPAYAALKRSLAQRFGDDRAGYTEAKTDFFWQVIRRADSWAWMTGWRPGPSDG